MRVTVCDVCEEKYGPGDPMIEMTIPAYFINEEVGPEALQVDVCSWECVDRVSRGLVKSDEPDSEPEEEPEAFIAVPKLPTIDSDMDRETLAKFSEQATGVKRR
jgi:hypothetical protein